MRAPLAPVAVLIAAWRCSASKGLVSSGDLLLHQQQQQQAQPEARFPSVLRRDAGSSPNATARPAGTYELVDTYDSTNLFEMFNFFSGNDPTHGFVDYVNSSEAARLGLVSTATDGTARLKVDDATVLRGNLSGTGRRSVRLESVASYREGLIVADFSYLPQRRCGSWPAFWTFAYEPGWPNGGEIDIYEQWNMYNYNRQTLHVNTSFTGNCSLTTSYDTFAPLMTNHNYTVDCNVTQPENTGCTTWDFEGPYASRLGGVYALEISRAANAVRLWSWHHDALPPDLAAATYYSYSPSFSSPSSFARTRLDPSAWGAPGLLAGGAECDVGRTFANQTVVVNIALCGDAPAGKDWVESGCAAETGYNSCERYVAANPGDFADVWFGLRSVKVYQAKR